jgi:enamine deaminase RidA (YjgF/YER057c/UK114 family)
MRHGSVCEHCITACAPDDALGVFKGLSSHEGTALSQFVFGGRDFYDHALGVMEPVQWPITWVIGDACSGEHLGGSQWITVSGTSVDTVKLDGQTVGRVYEDDDARYCYLGGLLPADITRPRPQQTRSCFERMEQALKLAGMDFSHVARTWLYLDRLLQWYDEFNAVRNAFFEERGVFDKLVPASTGIGAANFAGAALVTGLLAIKPKSDRLRVFAVPSPLQCPAIQYRSAFSRAVEVARPGLRQLYISGTASIAPDGKTAHLGDPVRQIRLTMEVVEAILQSRRMKWSDVTRMIAYYKDMADMPHFETWCRQNEVHGMPVVSAHADVCRDDLLFEVELDAATTVA